MRSVEEQYAYALSLISEGRMDTAQTILQNVLISNPNHADARNDLGVLYFHKGELEQAAVNLEAAYRIKGPNQYVISNLAEVYKAAGLQKEAEELLRALQ